jgi:ribA/ribD-fused uncharacterized protein
MGMPGFECCYSRWPRIEARAAGRNAFAQECPALEDCRLMDECPLDVATLLDWMRQGKRVKFLFFWGHQPERDGRVGRGCLSQWWPAEFVVDGRTFATAEHYMMWRKATLFGDAASAEKVLAVEHPQQAKKVGRGVRGFDQSRWEACRYEIVLAGTVAKFEQHPDLRRFLLSTGQRVLVEASPLDRVWGIGLAADDPAAEDPARWRGSNLLGFALTQARAVLADQG